MPRSQGRTTRPVKIPSCIKLSEKDEEEVREDDFMKETIASDRISAHRLGGDSRRGSTRSNSSGLLLAFLTVLWVVLLQSAVQTTFAEERQIVIQDDGMVTSVEHDTVFIDRRGYLTSNLTKVIDMDGKRISLKKLQFPVKVKIEYVYTQRGPVIRRMKAMGR